jgi:predicted N-acetyltransferase YhbS
VFWQGPRPFDARRAKEPIGMADHEITVATPEDITGILDLQEQNLRSNGGALSVPFSSAWFELAITDMPIIVARRENRVVGYLVSTPLTAQAHSPIIQAMLRAFPGSPGAYNYGPVCVSETERGRGLAGAMFQALRERLPARQGITFVRSDNHVSRRVHTRMGMQEVAEFTQDEGVYVVMAYVG